MRLFPTLLVAAFALGASAGKLTQIDGVSHIQNSAKPSAGSVTIELSDPWQRGDDSDDIIFGRIAEVLRDLDGNSYVLDQQLGEIQVFDSGGEWLRAIGRKGEGPGEFNPDNAADMFFTPGGKIAVAQRFPGRIIQLNLDGVAESDFPLPTNEGFLSVNSGHRAGENLVVGGTLMTRDENGMKRNAYIRLFSGQGELLEEMFREAYDFDFTALLFDEKQLFDATNAFAVDGAGRILVARSWDDYAIHVYGPDGKLQHVIEREYDPGKRSEAEVEAVKGRYQIVINGREATVKVAEANRAILGIIPRPDGSIWVRHGQESKDLPAGCLARMDEYDADGNYVREIVIKAPGNATEDGIYVRGDVVYIVPGANIPPARDEDAEVVEGDPLRLLCYQLPSSALARQ